MVAFPQKVGAALSAVGVGPTSLSQILLVQFVGEGREELRRHPDLQVSVPRLRAAFQWLAENSWPWMEATRDHELWPLGGLHASVEELLRAYAMSVGSEVSGVPAELLQGATRIAPDAAGVQAAGPADCNEQVEDDADPLRATADTEMHMADNCAGIIDGGMDEVKVLEVWNWILHHYKCAQTAKQEYARLKTIETPDEITRLKMEEAKHVSEAVRLLSQLHQKDMRASLDRLVASHREDSPVTIPHSSEFLNNRDPLFWCKCFIRLFLRGDCSEKCPARPTFLPAWRWAKTLLTRADFPLWRQDVEFIASVYNVHLRREQVAAVEVTVRKTGFTPTQQESMAKLSSASLLGMALASGDVNSVREALRKRNLDAPIDAAFRQMELAQ